MVASFVAQGAKAVAPTIAGAIIEDLKKGSDGKIVKVLKGLGDVAVAVKNTSAAVKPLVPDVNMGEIGAKGKDTVAKGVGVVSGAFAKLGAKKADALDWFSQIKDERSARKALREIQQATLENAHTTIEAKDLLSKKDDTISPLASMPGCFVITLYSSIELDKDLTDYLGIFVGKGDNLAEDIPIALSKAGNPDVYADVKYEKNVHIYAFNCTIEEVEESYASLCEIFGDDERCYN